MPWGRLDDGLYDHPKLDALGRSKLAAVGLWTLAISWSNRRLSDGFVPTDRVIALGGTAALADVLVDARLFDRTDGGYLIHDFLSFNESREQVEFRREADRKRKRSPQGTSPEASGKLSGLRQDSRRLPEQPPARAGSRPGPTRPLPSDSPPTPAERGIDEGEDDGDESPSTPRTRGESPRQLARAEEMAKRERASRRQQGALRGLITNEQLDEMNQRDAPLSELPTWEDAETPPSTWFDTKPAREIVPADPDVLAKRRRDAIETIRHGGLPDQVIAQLVATYAITASELVGEPT